MPTVHHGRQEVLLKVVYYGPGLGGKTTNLEYIHGHSRPEYRGKLLSLNTGEERTLFFDLLPVELGRFKGYTIRLHLCTVPGQIRYDRTRKMILRNADGVVFVIDSQPAAIEANIESLRNLSDNLREQGLEPTRVPLVVQYNKRDLAGVMDVAELQSWLGVSPRTLQIEASAKLGHGVFETLKMIVRECLALVGDPRDVQEGRSPSIMPGHRASMFPGALAGGSSVPPPAGGDDSRSATSVVPRAPRVPSVSNGTDD